MQFDRFLDILACPECLGPLVLRGEALVCERCAVAYPLAGGVPVLLRGGAQSEAVHRALASEAGQRMQAEYGAFGAPHPRPSLTDRFRAFLDRLKTPLSRVPHRALHEMYHSRGDATRILSVGGGPTRNNDREINLNIGLFPNVDVVADAHHLPFAADSLDGVWINAVLEHVADPQRVAQEIGRVVRPGGCVFVYQPFLQSYHAYPSDFWRFTVDGVERIFPAFDKLESGAGVGPTFALLKLAETYLATYLPVLLHVRSRRVLRALLALYVLAFYWLKHLDRFLLPTPQGHELASVVYFLGRRKEGPKDEGQG